MQVNSSLKGFCQSSTLVRGTYWMLILLFSALEDGEIQIVQVNPSTPKETYPKIFRICPGRYLAERNGIIYAAAIVSALDIVPPPGESIPTSVEFTGTQILCEAACPQLYYRTYTIRSRPLNLQVHFSPRK